MPSSMLWRLLNLWGSLLMEGRGRRCIIVWSGVIAMDPDAWGNVHASLHWSFACWATVVMEGSSVVML